MVTETSEFEAAVAHFKAIAESKLKRLRESVRYESFLTEEAIEAFDKVEGSILAGKPSKRSGARRLQSQ